MISRAGGAGSQFPSPDERAVEADLLDYAARVSPVPSAAFVDRAVAAMELSPLSRARRSPRFRPIDLVHATSMRLRVAMAQVAGGPYIPLRMRLQAGAMLVVAALLITAGAALAAAGATTVVTWVAGPEASAAGSPPSASPQLSPSPASSTSPEATTPTVPAVAATDGQPSQNPGNCGDPSQKPGNGNKPSENPGNGNKPSENPGNGGGSSQSHKPTATAQP